MISKTDFDGYILLGMHQYGILARHHVGEKTMWLACGGGLNLSLP